MITMSWRESINWKQAKSKKKKKGKISEKCFFRIFLDALILVEMLALNCVLKIVWSEWEWIGWGKFQHLPKAKISPCQTHQRPLLVPWLSVLRGTPSLHRRLPLLPHRPNMWNTACRGLSWPTARRGLRKLHLCRIWSGATICTMGACLLFRPHTGHLIGPQLA